MPLARRRPNGAGGNRRSQPGGRDRQGDFGQPGWSLEESTGYIPRLLLSGVGEPLRSVYRNLGFCFTLVGAQVSGQHGSVYINDFCHKLQRYGRSTYVPDEPPQVMEPITCESLALLKSYSSNILSLE